ncbi:CLIP domain-containing serine protease HP8-like [Anopheles marshallii]|uniref:CLIP domain-containing serine protease HP8-like n=1 Tax=Anopheles marshallii TaxID=1521116 RepID=UPI00237C03AD|nr:CLIP domain-containing serine protease HP8-like [Anopheles marshallii]
MVRALVSVLLLIVAAFVAGCCALSEQIGSGSSKSEALITGNESCGHRHYESAFPIDTRLYEHPWLVLFGYKQKDVVSYVFQGLLIHPKYVLTTVFVAQFKGLGQLSYARIGDHNTSTVSDCEQQISGEETCAPQVQTIHIDELIVHPDYNSFQQVNDVALVKLRIPANIDGISVAQICLNRESNIQSSFLLVAAWCGRRETGLSLVPKQYFMKAITPYECQRRMPHHTISLANEMFCVIFDERHTQPTEVALEPNLRGGSGAPVYTVYEDNRILLIGLLSYGPRYPAKLHEPYIITPVAPFYNWISEIIGGDLEKHMYKTLI